MTAHEARSKIETVLSGTFGSVDMEAPVPENLLTDLIRSIIDAYGDENLGGLDTIRANEISDCLKNVVQTLSEYENTAKNIAQMTNDNIPVITNLISDTNDSRVKAASSKLNELHGKLKSELSKADATIKTFRTHVEQMKKNSKIDQLTKTYNYIAYLQDMKPILRIGQERDLDLCMILIEITNLNEIARQHGNDVSSKVLIYVTKILNALIRQENRVYRYNNDTFLIVMNRSAEENLASTEERIISKLTRQKVVYSDQNIELVIHSGKSFHKQNDDIDSFTDRARSDKRRILV